MSRAAVADLTQRFAHTPYKYPLTGDQFKQLVLHPTGTGTGSGGGANARPTDFIMSCFCRDEISMETVSVHDAAAATAGAAGTAGTATTTPSHHHHQSSKQQSSKVHQHQTMTRLLEHESSAVVFSWNSLAGYCTCGATAYGAEYVYYCCVLYWYRYLGLTILMIHWWLCCSLGITSVHHSTSSERMIADRMIA